MKTSGTDDYTGDLSFNESGDLEEHLRAFSGEHSVERIFRYVSGLEKRAPRRPAEERAPQQGITALTPPHLHAAINRVIEWQNISKRHTFFAYARLHVQLSGIFEGGAGEKGPLEEPNFSPGAPLQRLFDYVTRPIAYPETKQDSEPLTVFVPKSVHRQFKASTVIQGISMTDVILRYALFHLHMYRELEADGKKPVWREEEAPPRSEEEAGA